MRETKFRGKRIDTGEFVYGDLYYNGLFYYIIPEYSKAWTDDGQNPEFELIEVVGATVGEFTGLKDEDGKEVYEGDLIQNDPLKLSGQCWPVEMDRGCFGAKGMALRAMVGMRVIGNIYQNPELLSIEGK